jgi:hypothetical protein
LKERRKKPDGRNESTWKEMEINSPNNMQLLDVKK